MYVCVCKAVTDSDVRAEVRSGTTTLCGLRERLGCTGQCGKCAGHVKLIRDETLAETLSAEPVLAPA